MNLPEQYIKETNQPKNTSTIEELIQEASFIEVRPGHCLVLRDEFKYGGTIIIPNKAKKAPTTGRVVGVGDSGVSSGERDMQNWLGRRVIWGRYSGTPIEFDGRPAYDLLSYEEVLAFLNDDGVKLSMEQSMEALNRE